MAYEAKSTSGIPLKRGQREPPKVLQKSLDEARPSPVHLFTVTNIQEYIRRMAQRNGNSTLLLE